MTLRNQPEKKQIKHFPTNFRWHEHCTKTKQLVSNTSRLTSLLDCTPASDPAISTVVEHTAAGCQTHRSDVVCEFDWWGESEQSDVVVVGVAVIVWMQNDSGNSSGHFVWVCALQVLTTKGNLPSICVGTTEKMINCLDFRKNVNQTYFQSIDWNTEKYIPYYIRVSHLEKQWAADITHSLLMREPPQTWLPNLCRLTCQGQLPAGASSPPTIRVFSGVMPHTEKNVL